MYRFMLLLLFLVCLNCTVESETGQDKNARLKNKAKLAKTYCKENSLNSEVCILIDMKIPSGKKRFFLWDFKEDSILKSGMCSHGSCGNIEEYSSELSPQFSNVPESHCSSLGKYKIGNRGYSSFGINVNYKLHGLEPTNNNAYKRFIVFHSWGISNEEVYPNEISESWGCPAVSNEFMKEMDKVLQDQKDPVLLWIFF